MKANTSPWLHELPYNRESKRLTEDVETDVAIVGAGIAGVSTAFFALKYTKHDVVLLDKGRAAHGATGHNAGQVVADFERPFADIVKEFGLEMACAGVTDLESSWELLSEMFTDARVDIPFVRITGYVGYSNLTQTLLHLEDMALKREGGVPFAETFISADAPFLAEIPEKYHLLYAVVPHDAVLERLESKDPSFYVAVADQRGCLNSALFCEKVIEHLLKGYEGRFRLFEETPVVKVVLRKNGAMLDALTHTVACRRVVLATNGFENFEIFNEGGLAIDKEFHHSVEGRVSYMSAYLEHLNKPPVAISYFGQAADPMNVDDIYFYLTRRPYDYGDEAHKDMNIVCVGGPEARIEDRGMYFYDYDYSDKVKDDIDEFLHTIYKLDPNKKITFDFSWHGLMGYTPNRIRRVGIEPKNPVLLYNLGCNGIGIIPSIYGGRRLAHILGGKQLPPSIFDPQG